MYFLENCLGTRNAPFCMGNSHRYGLFSNIIIECNPTEMFSWRTTNRKTKPMYQRRDMDLSLNLLYIKPHVGCTILNCKRLKDVLLSQFLLQNNQILITFFPTSVSKIRSLSTTIHTQGGPARSHLKSCYVRNEIEV